MTAPRRSQAGATSPVRRWPVAVAVSVVAHLLVGGLLWAALPRAEPVPTTTTPPARPLEVLRVGSLMPRRGAGLDVVPASPASAPVARAAARVVPVVTSPEVAPSEPMVSDALPTAPVEGVGTSDGPGGDGPGDGVPDGGEGRGAGVGAAGTEGEGGARVDLEALTRLVHARLSAAARDCYPPAAKRFRQVGRVPLRFCVDARLDAERVVVTPSGSSLLDEAAGDCVVRRAAPFPAEAMGRCFEVAVDFGP